MSVALVGVGVGAWNAMTLRAQEVLLEADVVVGAARIVDGLPDVVRAPRVREALPHKIAALLLAHPEWERVCVVLSGDVGFYSGARQLLALLDGFSPELVPGLSSPQYFAARLRRPWQDFRLVSAHGVRCDVLAEALNHPAVLFLTGGEITPAAIAAELCEAGLGDARITVGENLSYPEENILASTAEAMAGAAFAPLSVVLVENEKTFARSGTAFGVPDAEFVRGDVPMTKREVRVLALSLLRIETDSIVYDVGAGTGSVAVESGLLARRGRVYAVERDADALDLLDANRRRFGAYNVCPVFGEAPEALEPLPAPDAVFIGGSGRRMRAIVDAALSKNPGARLVVSAIALETLSAAMTALRECGVENVEVTQLSASRAAVRGGLHMLEARNPVFLVSGGGA